MKILKISKKMLESIGSNSLEGTIFKEFGEFPKELRIEFEQTSTLWKQTNNGPEEIILPEHVPMVLCESILNILKQNYCEKLEIGEYNI
jgi:hypothetical protein